MQANLYWHNQRASGLLSLLNLAGWTLRIYQGTMPQVTDISGGFTLATYASQLLIAYAVNPATCFARTSDNYQRVFMSNVPTPVAATGTGTATWFSLLYSTSTYVIVGDVTDATGTAALKLFTTNIVSGTIYPIYSFAFQLHQ